MSFCYPQQILGLLLACIAGIPHVHCFYASVSVDDHFANNNAVLGSKRIPMGAIKVLFNSEEGLRYN